ncbi:MAG TPA: methyltransferase domain-containing protein, partial [Chloroflexota bacterium]|nr:methyltransferase domain-containing protein [Chloroflexota bacterium]
MPTETAADVQARLDGLIESTWGFSALAAAAEVGLLGMLDPSCTTGEAALKTGLTMELATGFLDVLASVGLAHREGERYVATAGLRQFLATSQPDDVLAWLRSAHLQSRDMVEAARRRDLRPGWLHTNPDLLQAQGREGRTSVHAMAAGFAHVPGLQERLQRPGATFLDIGMGVGIISIEMCRIYPHLHVVGLEPGVVQADEARRNIAAAGFEDRIEVRAQRLEDLADREAYDTAYLPQVFMPLDVVKAGLGCVYEALRPGGWITLVAISAPGAELRAVISRLRNVIWGGAPLSPDDVAGLTRAAGF